MTRVLVTGAGGSATANVIDALRLAGTTSHIVGADASAVKLHLSAADERAVIPLASDPGWADAIAGLVAKHSIDVVWSQPDPEATALGAARDRVGAATFLPTQRALELAADKAAFADAMQAGGVDVPESRMFASWDDLRTNTAELLTRHPQVWVRARRGAGSRASLPVSTVTQAEAWVRWWVDEQGRSVDDFMAAERLPGREFAYQSVWQDGRLIAGQARERVEYFYGFLTPHGQSSSPSVARTVKESAVDAVACAGILALDPHPHGVYCADIKTALDGTPKITEINAGRFFTTSNFFAHAGLNMPDMAIRAALGEPLTPVGSSPLPADLYWVRMVDMGYVLVPGDDLHAWPVA